MDAVIFVVMGKRAGKSSGEQPPHSAGPALALLNTCVDLIYIDPAPLGGVEGPFNSNRNYEIFWGETKEKRFFEDREAKYEACKRYWRIQCR